MRTPWMTISFGNDADENLTEGEEHESDSRESFVMHLQCVFVNPVVLVIVDIGRDLFKHVDLCSGLKKSIFSTYFESTIYLECAVRILDRNMKYLRSYGT